VLATGEAAKKKPAPERDRRLRHRAGHAQGVEYGLSVFYSITSPRSVEEEMVATQTELQDVRQPPISSSQSDPTVGVAAVCRDDVALCQQLVPECEASRGAGFALSSA